MKRIPALLFLLTVSTIAMAADSGALNQFTPPPGDASVDFLSQVFGKIVNMVASGTDPRGSEASDVLGQMMSVFCTGVLFLAMIFVGYTTVTGTINSAHDGEILGKKMSEIWVPLRTVGGTAVLLPLGSGYCLIQIAVLWVALQGVGLADKMWSAAIKQISQDNMIANPIIPDARPLAANILRYQVCAEAMNKQYADSGRATRIKAIPVRNNVTNTGDLTSTSTPSLALDSISRGTDVLLGNGPNSKYNAVWLSRYQVVDYKWRAVDANGNPDTTYINPDVCGGISWKESWESSESNANTKVIKAPIMAAHAAAVKSMISELTPIAQQIVAGQKPTPGAIDVATQHYVQTLRDAAKVAVQNTNDRARSDFLKTAESSGWIFAGTWYNHIVKMNDVMQSTLNGLPSAEPVSIVDGRETQEALQNYQDAIAVTNEYAKNRAADVKNVYYTQTDVRTPQDGEGAWEYIKKLLSAPFMGAINQITEEIAGSNLNHISQMKSFGDTIVVVGESLMLTLAVAAGTGSSVASKVLTLGAFDMGSALQMLAGVFTFMMIGLFIFGVTLSTYVPMVPFLTWTASVVNWFVLVIEAVLAAPIWAAAHIHPDGDDAVGKGGQGYMMILSLVMRPSLMLFGLVTSMLLMEPITGFVNSGFMSAVSGVQADSMTGIVSFLAYVTIYVIFMTTIVHTVFSLIHWIPDNVPRWIGANLPNGPVSPDQIAKEGHNVFGGAVNEGKSGIRPKEKKPGGNDDNTGGGKSETPSTEELL